MKLEQPPKNEQDTEKFNNFIHKDEYWLTDSDMKALETMKQKPENEDENSEFKFIRGNHMFFS